MRLSVRATTVAAALVGAINLSRPTYGTTFLSMIGSVYPWFHSANKAANVLISTVYALVDGAIAGCLFGLLYNALLDLNDSHALPGRHA
jgi:hypothetical protein